jgi:pSer/pThr/pTyr-binding forkhead associated (FHA) protein
VSRVNARVEVLDTEVGRTFTERFDATPIRIGRAPLNDLLLPHPAIAARHGEITIGPRFAYFRSRAWLRASRIDGVRVKRGRNLKLTHESVISIGPFEVRVSFRVRDRRYERERKVTPLALVDAEGGRPYRVPVAGAGGVSPSLDHVSLVIGGLRRGG